MLSTISDGTTRRGAGAAPGGAVPLGHAVDALIAHRGLAKALGARRAPTPRAAEPGGAIRMPHAHRGRAVRRATGLVRRRSGGMGHLMTRTSDRDVDVLDDHIGERPVPTVGGRR